MKNKKTNKIKNRNKKNKNNFQNKIDIYDYLYYFTLFFEKWVKFVYKQKSGCDSFWVSWEQRTISDIF